VALSTTVRGNEVILAGGTAIDTTISSGGNEFVFSDGVASGTTVSAGGTEYVYSGGSAGNTTIRSGGYQYLSGGTASGTQVFSGGAEYLRDGGQAFSTYVYSGGFEVISANGAAGGTDLSIGGTIDVTFLPYASGGTATLDPMDNVLTVTEGAHSYTQQLSGNYSGAYFHLSPDPQQGTYITLSTTPCFCAGTRIRTPDGEVPVEDLAIGDAVLTGSGTARPIRWIGFRRLDLARHREPELAQPILIRPDAIEAGAPCRPLRLSPDHALLLDGALIPVHMLVNGASIRRDTECRYVTYYHIELDQHDIVLAENLAAETYLDTGNRGLFDNAGLPLTLHPDFTAHDARRVAGSCRPFVVDAERLAPVWQRLAERARALGFDVPEHETTREPNLHLRIDGRPVAPCNVTADRYTFLLPSGGGAPWLVSRAARPSDAHPWVDDRRLLGVAISAIALDQGSGLEALALDDPAFAQGWWPIEHDQATAWRWTEGRALVPCPATRPAVLQLTLHATLDYPLPAAAPARRALRA